MGERGKGQVPRLRRQDAVVGRDAGVEDWGIGSLSIDRSVPNLESQRQGDISSAVNRQQKSTFLFFLLTNFFNDYLIRSSISIVILNLTISYKKSAASISFPSFSPLLSFPEAIREGKKKF